VIDGLSEYASGFAGRLFESFPWLEEHAKVDPHPETDAGSLLVEYSPEPIRELCQLRISTDRGEVTIGFGRFHSHFDWPRPDDDEWWEDPLAFLADLIEERTLIQDWTKGGKWSGSSTLERGAEPDLTDMGQDNLVHVRSWTGSWDRTIHPSVRP